MILLPQYLFIRLFHRFSSFLYNWYVGSFQNLLKLALNALEGLDRSIAIKVSAKHLFTPMYGDRSFTGYVLGFIFRILRIIIGLFLYIFITLFFVALYLVWAMLPILILVWGFSPGVTSL